MRWKKCDRGFIKQFYNVLWAWVLSLSDDVWLGGSALGILPFSGQILMQTLRVLVGWGPVEAGEGRDVKGEGGRCILVELFSGLFSRYLGLVPVKVGFCLDGKEYGIFLCLKGLEEEKARESGRACWAWLEEC